MREHVVKLGRRERNTFFTTKEEVYLVKIVVGLTADSTIGAYGSMMSRRALSYPVPSVVQSCDQMFR